MQIIGNTIKKLLNNLFYFIDKKAELKVWQKSDRWGKSYWLAFDPITGLSHSFGSEAEVRIWIEQHQYSQAK